MKARYQVGPDEGGRTLADAVRRALPELSWSAAKAVCERGQVTVDGERATDPTQRVRAGVWLDIDRARPKPRGAAAVAIVYEDPHVVVVNKPAGVSSVPYEKRETGTAMDLVRAAWRAQGKKATEQPLFVVHRIDKETSGLIAFAKSKLAERGLQDLLRAHDVERMYQCVVHGEMTSRRIESCFVEDRGDGLRGSTRNPGEGKRAVTHVTAVESLRGATRCEVRLETGKTHQIRIHLAECGHPIVGERVYVRDYLKFGGSVIDSPRLLLHAATLGFVHPITHDEVRLSLPPPDDFNAVVASLHLRNGR